MIQTCQHGQREHHKLKHTVAASARLCTRQAIRVSMGNADKRHTASAGAKLCHSV